MIWFWNHGCCILCFRKETLGTTQKAVLGYKGLFTVKDTDFVCDQHFVLHLVVQKCFTNKVSLIFWSISGKMVATCTSRLTQQILPPHLNLTCAWHHIFNELTFFKTLSSQFSFNIRFQYSKRKSDWCFFINIFNSFTTLFFNLGTTVSISFLVIQQLNYPPQAFNINTSTCYAYHNFKIFLSLKMLVK